MRFLLTTFATAALLTACSNSNAPDISKDASKVSETTETLGDELLAGSGYDLSAQYNKFAKVTMEPDVSFLSASEKAVVNKLMTLEPLMNAIYLRQLSKNNPALRAEIVNSDAPNKALLLSMFDQHYGVCDSLAEGHVFYGNKPCAPGGGFYPEDMTKIEFEAWIAAHPGDEAAFRSGYTVIARNSEGLYAVPYHEAYKEWVEPAAAIMREAAALSEEPTLKRFLTLRADAFLKDDYFKSEMAWMDLEGNIEIAIGPYEVYDDGLFGYKTAYEMFLTVKNPEESAALSKYKDYLRDMEANLPVPEKYKNFKRGFESPIAVTYQIKGGGDNVPGVQTIAFNLPNDERVREAKGAKKVILNNVLGAKYDRILSQIGERVLVADQAKLTAKKWMSYNTLFHELSHSLGPGSITVDGVETTVSAQLKELYAGLEEGKADVMGAYNILYMMERGELPIEDKNAFLATYFTGKFRSMRFGTGAAHAKGAAFQYALIREMGAAEWVEEEQRYRLDFKKLEQAISDIVAIAVKTQADGSYDNAKAFLESYTALDAEAETVLGKLSDIPYDIRPIYPEKL